MDDYNILEWVKFFEDGKNKVSSKDDFLDSGSRVLYPGRFYVLSYSAKTKERYNARPDIISMGISKKDPDSFLCVDLCVIPKKARLKFIEMFFNIFKRDIQKNIDEYFDPDEADKQSWIRSFSYDNVCKMMPMIPIKNAIKRYKIENTRKIYSVPFSKVYKIIGDYCDEDHFVNGHIVDVQREFLEKVRR